MSGTIPSTPIPIPKSFFGIELTLNSDSTVGIGAATPTPIQWNWGDSTGIPILKFTALYYQGLVTETTLAILPLFHEKPCIF